MMSFKTVLGLLLLAMVAMVAESSWGNGKGNSYSYDISKMSDLTKLYNSKVFLAERMTRPLEGMKFQVGKFSHSGVRVTLEDGTKWLIHKGDGYGISSQTVVVAARHMSNNWTIVETKNFRGTKTVSAFVSAGGTDYKLLFDNCHDAADRMMDENGPYKYDLSNKSDLNKLYNSKVYMAELFTRPLDGMPFQIGRVTLQDGSKWLIHKGDSYGKSSQTVVVDGRHMSSNWKASRDGHKYIKM